MFFPKKQNPPAGLPDANESSAGFVFIRKALLVVEGSQPSVQATTFAIKLARQTGCELLAVSVVDTATLDYLLQLHI
ncbi:MAG: universal stress protein, partial [Oligosphaeraceae bacterium]|nr:universal stress protein [Oligosphaeraceae bacterium]